MGAEITVDGLTITLRGGEKTRGLLKAVNRRVPGDFSSAAFWLTAAAVREGYRVTVQDVGLNPRRTALLNVLQRMGAKVDVCPENGDGRAGAEWEPSGTVTVEGRALTATEIGGDEIPNLIDELPLAAVAAALAEGRTTIRDAAELRVKESDRIAAMAAILAAFGVPVRETADGMIIEGVRRPHGGAGVDSRGDHRMAMAAAVLGLMADGPTRIDGTACIATSYPAFWEDLKRCTIAPAIED
jgi:3-phosphoshikimate 1-carboxyvinyltransferase